MHLSEYEVPPPEAEETLADEIMGDIEIDWRQIVFGILLAGALIFLAWRQ